ncbi:MULTISPECIES: DddA-like double-stranded DNA deaminase toxin [Actinosynnema]|uniref:DddA-like double-stranded DNA deaminase toxin n=1 Tax=Actinosynnema TaxID=40566 RepID=UPI0020A424E3|nr:DddA-like double-stranded DNA deaminase toxin [Actinosynnema pretiosum]MCP2093400.1 SCP1.201-like deaminase [Actinosynnema pretiosum]
MASLGEVGAALRRAVALVEDAVATANTAGRLATEAGDLLAAAGEGTSRGDVAEARATFAAVAEGIEEPEGLTHRLAAITDAIRAYAARNGVEDPVDGPHGTPVLDRIATLREELPPPVVPGKGQKTHGRWFDGSGAVRDSVSGKDADSVEAWRLLRESGIPLPRPPVVVAHAEMKVAAAMRRLNHRRTPKW